MGRTSNGYVYSESDPARLDLIRAQHDAGVGLKTIRKMLSRDLTLTEVLQMKLGTLEAEIASRRRIAAVLRATLSASGPTESDLRRLWAMTTLSNAQLRKVIESFIDKVVDGFQVDDAWKAQMRREHARASRGAYARADRCLERDHQDDRDHRHAPR